MTKLSQGALDVAISQMGEQESPKGSNWGPSVRRYLDSVGIDFPASWCMAFVYWCHEMSAVTYGVKNTLYKSGGVLKVWNNSPHSSIPEVGSIFILNLGHGLGHTGFVERFDKDNIYTIEGNTNDTGSREGYMVCKRTRPRRSIQGYIILS